MFTPIQYYMLFSSDTKGERNMDIKTRVLVARLTVKIDESISWGNEETTKHVFDKAEKYSKT